METKWYIMYTKPNCEQKVAEILRRKNIINFCPLNKVIKSGKENTMDEEVLFNCYVFIKTFEYQIAELKQIKGVINFIYWMQKPAVIDDQEITLIKNFRNNHTNIKIERV
jgi:transcription antitermination factor NusG